MLLTKPLCCSLNLCAEFDAPAELLRDEATIFAELCRQTGASSLEKLRAGAERHAQVLRYDAS
jgi:hypothetical protein